MTKVITSLQNPLVKNIILLTEKPRERKEQNLIVIEGSREIRLALASGSKIVTLVFCPDLATRDILYDFSEAGSSAPERVEVPAGIFNRLAYRKDHEGVIALAVPGKLALEDLRLSPNPLILVLETVEKPGNLGALLRTADAAGLDAVIICDPQTDLYNPNTIRSSLGCIFTMQTVSSSSQEAIDWLKSRKIRIFGTALTAADFYNNADLTVPAAIVMGSEAFGLSRLWLEQSDVLIKIPMNGKVDSMNVSASAAVVVFEALRQRGFQ